MAVPVEMPKLGNTVEECVLTKWLKQTGERVAAGETVAEIETDKATFDVAAPRDGIVLARFFGEGTVVPVYTNLFVIGEAGESVEAFRPGPLPSAHDSETAPRLETEHGPQSPGPPSREHRVGMAPVAYSPRARRFAEDHNFYPAAVLGSGPGGRIMEEDLRNAFYLGAAQTAIAAAPVKAAKASSIRKKIAQRMRESLASTAQYTLNASADATQLLSMRRRLKETAASEININDLVAWCTIRALLDFPAVNSNERQVHLGFACDTPRGLIVPVVRNADGLTAAELATRMKTLAATAIAGSISPDDLTGATFTISNLGALGIESFTPILNPPQAAILGVSAIQLKPVRRDGEIAFIDFIGLSLTCDHQVIDGAPGARFLQAVREKIENVESLCTI